MNRGGRLTRIEVESRCARKFIFSMRMREFVEAMGEDRKGIISPNR